MKMKTKRLAVILAVALALACCAVAWGDLLLSDPLRYKPRRREWESPQIFEALKPLSDDVQDDTKQQDEERSFVVLVYAFPREELMVLRFLMEGPGEYEYTLCNDKGQTVMSDKGVNKKFDERNIDAKTPCDLGMNETASYTLEASFIPYYYQETGFGPKLIEGPEGGPLMGGRHEFKSKFTVKNANGRGLIRKDE